MPKLHDTQPSRAYYLKSRNDGLRAPPRLLFWGLIVFTALVLLGTAGVIFGFREILQPAQQQRVIDQLPFMSILRNPTPIGGVFPTIVSPANEDAALSLLDMPLNIPSPTADSGSAPAELATATSAPTATATSTATNTMTPLPEATATSRPASTPAAPPTAAVESDAGSTRPIPPSARIYGILHHQQTWNNCGPATITMALSYYGWTRDQAFAAGRLKPNREDKNVSPEELAAFVEEESNVKAIVRMGGTLDLLKRLVANEFPVVIETAAMFEAYDWIGHYRALVAYDDAYELFYFFDSFLGVGDAAQGVSSSYADVDANWGAFNRTFIVVYEPQREGLLRELLGSYWVEAGAARIAFETAREEARRQPQNAFAWFNMGSSLVAQGRYQEAAAAFDQANRTGQLPWRMHWYQFGPFEAYFQVGRYEDVLSLVRINQNNARELEETYYWQGRVLEAQGNPQGAAASFRRALGYNPHFDAAREALERLN
ncbi:MAG: C39 family peptidase [Chloroflexota bacterium]|nr:C39 family peptidase [Chloroflexota bacterium]MDE2947022.1 C39 family peptidase [Chloroflexota bacterium]